MLDKIATFVHTALIICLIGLAVIGLLRWLGSKDKRGKRLNLLCLSSLIILFLPQAPALLVHWESVAVPEGKVGSIITSFLIEGFKLIVKILLSGGAFGFLLVTFWGIFIVVVFGLRALYRAGFSTSKSHLAPSSLKSETEKENQIIFSILHSRSFLFTLTGAILSGFFLVPLFMGSASKVHMSIRWVDGITRIGQYIVADTNVPMDFPHALSLYMLTYIIVLGTGFAAANIIYVIVSDCFTKRSKDGFLNEYSNSIGLLGVGVALLYTMFFGNDKDTATTSENELQFGKPLVRLIEALLLVAIIVALVVLTLEIVRLLMDIKDTLIRRQARYLFIGLIGQCTILLLQVFFFLFQAIANTLLENSSANSKISSEMESLQNRILEKVLKDIHQELDDSPVKENGQKGSSVTVVCFTSFNKATTRKAEEDK